MCDPWESYNVTYLIMYVFWINNNNTNIRNMLVNPSKANNINFLMVPTNLQLRILQLLVLSALQNTNPRKSKHDGELRSAEEN